MLLWVEMPGGRSGMRVFEEALRQGIRVAPERCSPTAAATNTSCASAVASATRPRSTAPCSRWRASSKRAGVTRALGGPRHEPGAARVHRQLRPVGGLGGTLLEGESVVVFAGFLAHQHLLRLPGVMLCAFAGSLIADQALFYLGRRWRDHRLVLRLRAAGLRQGAGGGGPASRRLHPQPALPVRAAHGGTDRAGRVERAGAALPGAQRAGGGHLGRVLQPAGLSVRQTIESLLGRLHGVENCSRPRYVAAVVWLVHRWLAKRRR